ncbi:hypothetical protein SKAU_G00233470 [Synaphobranchus kaupii]|uniref:Uncharacterized protein n=1 Tax=Synaphobranchus kaupii TaxID=118154 RepID=A0A9Q1F645_SYNKA|nr:hypothetical protein SKAU_G00233470 [Synaphobranchus kaupii]
MSQWEARHGVGVGEQFAFLAQADGEGVGGAALPFSPPLFTRPSGAFLQSGTRQRQTLQAAPLIPPLSILDRGGRRGSSERDGRREFTASAAFRLASRKRGCAQTTEKTFLGGRFFVQPNPRRLVTTDTHAPPRCLSLHTPCQHAPPLPYLPQSRCPLYHAVLCVFLCAFQERAGEICESCRAVEFGSARIRAPARSLTSACQQRANGMHSAREDRPSATGRAGLRGAEPALSPGD